jgi:hypothetical protein
MDEKLENGRQRLSKDYKVKIESPSVFLIAAPSNREINPWRSYSGVKMQEIEGTREQR